ncbi:MAG: rRNA maturation RNase YbeY [Nitrospira sp.]|jgi:rRNA maturation RNase YbeY|nr:rRNA maturation RNase YbeY [Nitrospira sp.]MDC8448144.1 rRNA maturation RNase YbeY [Nitrospira sp.]MDI3465291.1 Metal-dependent hydrolase YbeY, involved in rRNA and/or ribosome maturation and assembly [Nitrospira sp.]
MAVYLRVHLTRFAVRQSTLAHLTERVLSAVGESRSELSLELIGERRMRRLNREYRKKDRPTDVLAFPIREAVMPRGMRPVTQMLGDVVISLPTAVRQAREARRSIDDELAMLLVHGVLHLCGYDHECNQREAARMSRRERALFHRISPVPRIVTFRTERRTRGH